MKTGEGDIETRPLPSDIADGDERQARRHVAARHISRKVADAHESARRRIQRLVDQQKAGRD